MGYKEIKATEYKTGNLICTIKGFHITELIKQFRKDKIFGVHFEEI